MAQRGTTRHNAAPLARYEMCGHRVRSIQTEFVLGQNVSQAVSTFALFSMFIKKYQFGA